MKVHQLKKHLRTSVVPGHTRLARLNTCTNTLLCNTITVIVTERVTTRGDADPLHVSRKKAQEARRALPNWYLSPFHESRIFIWTESN